MEYTGMDGVRMFGGFGEGRRVTDDDLKERLRSAKELFDHYGAEGAHGAREMGDALNRIEALETDISFLLERLDEWSADNLTDQNVRDWLGHVEPVIEHGRATLKGDA